MTTDINTRQSRLDTYTVRLPNFEGPLDLLLFFIKRDELDIYDIPIGKITREFLEYIRLMQLFDLELAGEFLVMASSLMQIKVRMLLPKEVDERGEELPGEDPRAELVQQLLQYSQYKEVSREFSEREEAQRYVYYRHMFDADERESADEVYKNATLFDLLAAFKKALERKPEKQVLHTVQLYSVTIEEQTEHVLMHLRSAKKMSFLQFVHERPRIFIVVTFLAILEMSKNQIISIRQHDNFDDIEIVPFEDVIETKTLDEVLHDDHEDATAKTPALPAPAAASGDAGNEASDSAAGINPGQDQHS